jgi:hypothetical protein
MKPVFRLTIEQSDALIQQLAKQGIERSHAIGLLSCYVQTGFAGADLCEAIRAISSKTKEGSNEIN